MSEQQKVYPVPADVASNALINKAKYEEMYKQSVEQPDAFWAEHGQRIDWMKPFSKVKNVAYRRLIEPCVNGV